jgi:branched-chain amino acid transport system permease protein
VTTTSEAPATSPTPARVRQAPRVLARHGVAMAGIVVLGAVAHYLITHLTGKNGQVAVLVVLWAVAVTGLNVVQGLGGYLSLAQASFYGGGAYISSLLLHHGLPMTVAAVLAVLAVAVGGLLVGLIFGRTRGQYFAIGTLFFAAVVTLVLNNEVDLTGGPNGLPVDLGWSPDTSLWLLAASLSLGLAVFHVLNRSRLGSRLLGIREDEDLAEHLGVPTSRVKLVALVISAVFGAWSGVLLAQYNGVISPSEFTYQQGFLMFVAVGLGGYGRLLTPVVGSVLVVGLPQMLDLGPGVSQIALGIIFIAITLLVPGGILGAVETGLRRLATHRAASKEDAP